MRSVANWKQIQARIRKARDAADPAGELTQLYEKTRDAMVAFELAKQLEKSGQNEDAARWYTSAAGRFRRADWKKKAAEAVQRLTGQPAEFAAEVETHPPAVESTEPLPEQAILPLNIPPEPETAASVAAEPHAAELRGKRRRRGRRGGRGRRRGREKAPPIAKVASAEPREPSLPPPPVPLLPRRVEPEPVVAVPSRQPRERPESMVPRTGDPAMSSRMAQLEMQLRRLIASPLYPLDEAEHAPAGPGVFILSDSDQVTYYYVEACRTIRIAVGHLTHTERGKRGEGSIRKGLAEHLGISEARVSKYLKDHCVVRWIQLDEGASHLAHFAIAVLRPVLNE